MKPQLTQLTLGVDDICRSVSFLRDDLGIPTHGNVGANTDDPAAFFDFGGITVSLRLKNRVAGEQSPAAVGAGPAGQSMRLSVSSSEAVDDLLRRAAKGGATIVRPAQSIWPDYSGAFQDLDGRLWEVSFQAGYFSFA
jgi:predicted lactoylglutathione lyase